MVPVVKIFLFFFLLVLADSSNYIRQLESKVRILEDDNKQAFSQVSGDKQSSKQLCTEVLVKEFLTTIK